MELELQTSLPGSNIWTGKGTGTYGGSNNTLVWQNVTFDPGNEAAGNGKYRFVWGDVVVGEFIGPNIDVTFKNTTYSRIDNTDHFDYKVAVKSSAPSLKIELVYTNDGLTWTRSNLFQEYNSSAREWKELVWKNQPWHKTVRFDVVRK